MDIGVSLSGEQGGGGEGLQDTVCGSGRPPPQQRHSGPGLGSVQLGKEAIAFPRLQI